MRRPSRGSAARAAFVVVPTAGLLDDEDEEEDEEGWRGVASGRGEVLGEERKAERAVTCGSVRSDTRVASGMDRRLRRREEVWCPRP